jgi:ABC-type uncharacterized transport system auxiliary subunit
VRLAALLVASLLLSACAIGRESLVLRDVALDPSVVPANLAPLAAPLQVDVPRAAEPLSDVRIALRDGDGAYAVMPGVRWRESAPKLVQSMLVEALEQCRCLAGVARTGAAARADYVLEAELRELAVDDGAAAARAVARLSLTLVRARDGRSVATTILERSVVLAARTDPAGIAALAAALNAVAGETVAWLHGSLREATNPRETP